MNRKIPDIWKNEQAFQRLSERYYGKKDLLTTWEQFGNRNDMKYRNDLKQRVDRHKKDLIYRGE
jgi:hypothetical protein